MRAEASIVVGFKSLGQATRRESFDIVGPGHHIPDICPVCHVVDSLILIECDTDDMSEGQQTDYLAGVSGIAYCHACKSEFDWGM
jgi:hypothetical protein